MSNKIVNQNNKILKLTRDNLQKIYTGVSTNWNDFGGDDMKNLADTLVESIDYFKV